VIGPGGRLKRPLVWRECAHKLLEPEAHGAPFATEVCRSTGACVKLEPHLRQKLACGGLVARQRSRVQLRNLTFAVTGCGRPLSRVNPIHNPRQITPITQAKKTVHPSARKAKTAKM
jgi:hypothetical protein